MKRTLRKATAFILAMAFVLQLAVLNAPIVPISAAGLSDFDYYSYDDGSVVITNYKGSKQNVVIPSSVDIAAVRIYGDNTMKSLTVPEGIDSVSIESDSLEKIVLPSTICYLDMDYCPNLVEIDASKIKGNTDDDQYYVHACPALTTFKTGKLSGSISLSALDSLESVDLSGCSFSSIYIYNNPKLKDLKLSKTATYVYLESLKSLNSVSIPQNARVSLHDLDFDAVKIKNNSEGYYIKDNALYRDYYDEWYCENIRSLEAIDFNEKVINVEEGTQIINKLNLSGNAYNTEVINLPDSVVQFDYYAFEGGSNLKELSIPKSVVSLYGYCFSGLNPDISLTIPETVTYISFDAFTGYEGKVSLDKDTDCLKAYKDGIYYSNIGSNGEIYSTVLVYYPSNKKSIEFMPGTTTVGSNVFRYSEVKSLNFPEGIRWLDLRLDYAYNLTSVSLPSTVYDLTHPMFIDAPALKKITISPDNRYYCSYKNCIYDKEMTGLIDVPGALENIVIPEGVLSLNYYTVAIHSVNDKNAEYGYRTISPSVSLPRSLEEVDYYTFSFAKASVYADSNAAGMLQETNRYYAEEAAEYGYEPYQFNYTLKDSNKNLLKMIYVVDSVTLGKGSTEYITYEMPLGLDAVSKLTKGNNTECQVQFSSSNKKIATVDPTGIITGKKKGTCTINVKCTINNGKSKNSKTFKVKVKVK